MWKYIKKGIVVPHRPLCTTAYAISLEGCKRAIKLLGKLSASIDTSLSAKCNKMDVYAFHPPIVKGHYRSSQINSEYFSGFLSDVLTRINFNHTSDGNLGYLLNMQDYHIPILNTTLKISYLGYVAFIIGLLSSNYPIFYSFLLLFICDIYNFGSIYITSLVLYLIGILLGYKL